MTRIHTIIFASCTALLLVVSGTVVAQETTTASVPIETTIAVALTTASESSNETTYYGDVAGDRAVRIVSVEYADGTAVLVLRSDLSRTVTVTASTGSTPTGAAVENLVRRPIPSGRTTIRIDPSEPRVTLVMSYSVEDGRYTEIRSDGGGSALIVGPFTGADVRDAVISGALGTPSGALLTITRQRFGLHRDMGRIV